MSTEIVPSVSQYQWEQMVKNLTKSGEAIMGTLTPEKMDLLHAAVGISGEAGELLDIVKKIVVYNKPFTEETRKHIIEEMGDMEFYMEQLRNNILVLITRMQCQAANYHKLSNKQNGRYASGKYSDQQAQDRLDKLEPAKQIPEKFSSLLGMTTEGLINRYNEVDMFFKQGEAINEKLFIMSTLRSRKVSLVKKYSYEYDKEILMRGEDTNVIG